MYVFMVMFCLGKQENVETDRRCSSEPSKLRVGTELEVVVRQKRHLDREHKTLKVTLLLWFVVTLHILQKCLERKNISEAFGVHGKRSSDDEALDLNIFDADDSLGSDTETNWWDEPLEQGNVTEYKHKQICIIHLFVTLILSCSAQRTQSVKENSR